MRFPVPYSIFGLTSCDVAYELRKSEWVTRTFLAGRGHADIIAWLATEGIGPSTASDFKLTHYPILPAPDYVGLAEPSAACWCPEPAQPDDARRARSLDALQTNSLLVCRLHLK